MEEARKAEKQQKIRQVQQQSEFEKKHKKFIEQLAVLNESDKQQKSQAKEKKKVVIETNHQFVSKLNEAVITIPDEIIDYNLEKAGCDCPDLRVKRLIGIAAKKLIHDVVQSSLAHRMHHIQGLTASKRKPYEKKVSNIFHFPIG